MARLGSKRIAEDFSNSGLAEALQYLHRKGWYEAGSPVTAEDFKQNQFEVNRGRLDRLVAGMLATGDAQSKLDYSNLRQWVRNYRRNKFKEVNGMSSLSCDLSQQAYGNLLKLVERTGLSQRRVVENLLLEGDATLNGEIKLLKNQKKEQSRKLQDRESRIKKKEEKLEAQEQKMADFKRNAQPILDLLRDIGKEGDASCLRAFKPILENLRKVGEKEGGTITVRDTIGAQRSGSYSDEERKLTHHLNILMMAMQTRGEEL